MNAREAALYIGILFLIAAFVLFIIAVIYGIALIAGMGFTTGTEIAGGLCLIRPMC